MSQITLEMLTDAAISTLPNATPAEQGELIAALVTKFDAELTVKPVAKKQTDAQAGMAHVRWFKGKGKPKAAKAVKTVDPIVGSGAAMAANHAGHMMKADKGTATKGQIKRLKALG